ncbi:hypothetical protein TNCV_345951 [Trichonephila clavipes]|nr:hypothetical protein TNCV_345951 [Trichonephila clavipes]
MFSKVGKRITFIEFRIQIVEELLHKYDSTAIEQKNAGRPPTVNSPACLTEQQFISRIPPNPTKCQTSRHCKVCCSKKNANGKKLRKETRLCKDYPLFQTAIKAYNFSSKCIKCISLCLFPIIKKENKKKASKKMQLVYPHSIFTITKQSEEKDKRETSPKGG